MKISGLDLEREIYRAVLDAVYEHRLPPGTKLTEDSLAQIFETSRTTIRRALIRLEHDKIVTFRPNRGAFILQPSIDEARQVFETRKVIEAAACQSAAGKLNANDAKKLKDFARSAHEARNSHERSREVRSSGDFHREIGRLSRNAILSQFLDELVFRSSLIVAQYRRPDAPHCSYDERLEIVDALYDNVGDRATDLILRQLALIESGLDLRSHTQDPINLDQIFAGRQMPRSA